MALVDRSGAVLLRMHGEQSATRPNRWSLPGGPALTAEIPSRAAARLVKEQTGLEVDPLRLRLSWRGRLPDFPAEVHLFAAASTATDADISTDPVPGAIARRGEYLVRFIPGDRVQSGRPFTPASGYVIGEFMTSRDYRELTEAFDPEEIA